MHNMRAHLLTLAKMATLPRLVQYCFKRKKRASGAITSMFISINQRTSRLNKFGVNGKIKTNDKLHRYIYYDLLYL